MTAEDLAAVGEVMSGGRQWCVVNADCLDVLPGLPAGVFDAVVTDPPYNVGFDYDSLDDARDDYPEWCRRWLAALESVCSGPIAISVGQANLSQWATVKPPAWWLAWWKPAAMGRCVVGFNNWEPIALDGKPRRAVCDVIRADILPDKSIGWHPCPKPLGWARKQVEMFTEPGDVVLDPFSGSATVGLACLQTGNRFVGVELSAEYAALSRRRLESAERDQRSSLFPAVAAPQPAIAPSLFD
jgi:hypothetical protein